jgi:hypothetical protein
VKTFYRSFAGGELTPEMFGRLDLAKFQTGVKRARNFMLLPHGPAARRPGFLFNAEAWNSAQRVRVIPFVFNATQAVMIEFGDLYCRFHTENGTVLEPAQSITSFTVASIGVFTKAAHGYTTGDTVFVLDSGGLSALNGRFLNVLVLSVNTFQLIDLYTVPISTLGFPAYAGTATMARVYTIYSPFDSTQLFDLHYAQDSDVLTLSVPTSPTYDLRRSGATSWAFTGVSFLPTTPAPTAPTAVATVVTATGLVAQSYVITTVAADGVTESAASAVATCNNNLALAGNLNTISWAAAAGASRYYVYKLRGGVYGFIGQTTTLSIVDDNILPDTSVTPPEAVYSLNIGSDYYPSAVAHFERRRWFAGTSGKPQTIWATRNGTLSNLTSSIPSREDDGMEFRIAAQQQNAIRHLVPLTDLVALTVGGEFRIFADGGPALSPSTISIKPQGFTGASNVQPAMARSSVLYVQSQGSRVNELSYDPSGTGSFRSEDVSLLAPHLFDGYTIIEIAYQRGAEPMLWVVRSDGALLSMTYVPEQKVFAWAQHFVGGDGLVESCAVIPESNRDVLYTVVRRTINGISKRYIERLSPRFFAAQEDAHFVDCALVYDSTPTATLRGLWHLEGEMVSILADGAVVADQVVSGGGITLSDAASVVHVGYGYTSQLETLPLALESVQAVGQGVPKNVNEVYIRVSQSSVLEAGPTFDDLRENQARAVSVPYDSPPPLVTGEIVLSIDPEWDADGTVCIQQDKPLPLTVVAMALDVAVGG